MSALLFAQPASVEATTLTSTTQNRWVNEHHRTLQQASDLVTAHCLASPYQLIQNASPWARSKLRRCFDWAIAFCGILLSLPLLITVGLIVRLTSRGPMLFRQKRMGRNGVEFTLYKFRSMKIDQRQGSKITVTGDSRITRVGRILRRYKLDELPQLWNVLRGDMSLVGPRPKLPHHEALLLSVRPGITGAATLAFRHEEEMLRSIPQHDLDVFYELFIKPTKARIDFEYTSAATFRSDVRLIWNTMTSCLRTSG